MIEAMEAIYCGSIGVEYMHIVDTKRNVGFNNVLKVPVVNSISQMNKGFLERLTAAEGLENISVINTSALNVLVLKAANLYSMVNEIIQRAGAVGCKEVVIGMPHRGRLNLLVNIMGKTLRTYLVSSKVKHFIRKVLVTLNTTKVSQVM